MAEKSITGILAEFSDPTSVYHAAEKIRDAGFKKWDVYSPFPIHGIDHAMGLKDSNVGWFALVGAIVGAVTGFTLQYWSSAVAYPLIISGKPFNSYPSWVPVTFELGILCTAFFSIAGMLILNKLPRWYDALFKLDAFRKVTDDGFFVFIESRDPEFDQEKSLQFLESMGGKNIQVVED